MVRIQRFALAFMLIGSFALSGCANTRTRFASLWKRGADDTFSESIVDNRELPKSAREMADSVQSSLKDTKANTADSKTAIAATTKKRYTKSAGKLDSLDTRIDDVIARAKTRSKDVLPTTSKSNFPDDPFLEEFDALADKPVRVAEKAKDSVFDQLKDTKNKMAESRDTFGGEAADIAEPLIAKANTFDDQFGDKVDHQLSDFEESVGGTNPFEELDDIVADHAVELDELDEPIADFIEKTQNVADTAKEVIADAQEADIKAVFEDQPDRIEPQEIAKTVTEPIVDGVAAAIAPSNSSRTSSKEFAVVDEALEDEFDLLFAEAAPSTKSPQRAFQESQFRPASAQRSATKTQQKVKKTIQQTAPTAARVDPRFGTDFDRMIVDSDELPQRSIPAQKQTAKSNSDSSDDQFTGVRNQLSTYDDFFETDNSVRANQPREASRESNPFSFIQPDRESQPTTIGVEPKRTPRPQVSPLAPIEQPVPVSPFEEFDELEEFDDNIPVAKNTRKPSTSKQPMRLVSMPSVVRVSGNTAADLTNRDLEPVQQPPTFGLAAPDSELDRTPTAELPTIVPGQKADGFSDEPYIDLSAVTQTPLENVAWEVESESAITSAAKGTSPWIAWIAVALCSIALILLLRPATNRIS